MEALVVLLVFGFSASAEPAKINVDDVMRYAPAEAEVFAYVNFDAVVQPTWDWLTNDLTKQKFAQGEEFKSTVADARAELEQGMAELRQFSGVDVMKDVHYGAIWFSGFDFKSGKIEFLALLNGNFPDDMSSNIATAAGLPQSEVVGDATIYYRPGDQNNQAFAVMQLENDVLIGSYSLLEARAEGYKRPKGDKGSQLARVAKKLADGPVMLVSLQMSAATQTLIASSGGSASLIDMATGFEWFDMALMHDGLDFALHAKNKVMYARYDMFMDGLVELMRAGQLGARGFARVGLASLSEKDMDLDPNIRAVLEFREEAVAYVEKYTGDGNFDLKDNSDAKKLDIDLSLRGNHLREVYTPIVGVLIAAGTML